MRQIQKRLQTGLNALDALLSRQGFVVLDGAMGTELERQGADLNDPLWSGRILRDDPQAIQRVHQAHLRAGAEVILSASYQVVEDALLTRAIQVAMAARAAESPEALVAGSMGPYGAYLADGSEYSGDYGVDMDTLVAFHRRRLQPLEEAGADLLAFETIPSLQEAQAIATVLRAPGLPAWVSFSCQDELRVSHGESIAECVAEVAGLERVVAVGVNCTAPSHVVGLLQEAAAQTDKPLVAYPNRGASWDASTHEWSCSASVSIADWVSAYYEAGARLIGGCCQTTPEDITEIRRALLATQR